MEGRTHMTGRARSTFAKATLLAGSIVLLASGCAKDAPQDTFQAEGPQAKQIAAPSTIAGKIRKWEKRMANLG